MVLYQIFVNLSMFLQAMPKEFFLRNSLVLRQQKCTKITNKNYVE